MSLSAGAKLGPYEVVAPLGAGGMGKVYRANDTRLGGDVRRTAPLNGATPDHFRTLIRLSPKAASAKHTPLHVVVKPASREVRGSRIQEPRLHQWRLR